MKNEVKSILVVDDEIEIQRLFKQRFRKRIQAKELDFVFASNVVMHVHMICYWFTTLNALFLAATTGQRISGRCNNNRQCT